MKEWALGADWLLSAFILVAAYVAARLVSHLLGRALPATVGRTPTSVDNRLLLDFKRPVTYALFLVGAYAAARRVPLDPRFAAPIDGALFVLCVLLVTIAIVRALGLLLGWYAAGAEPGTSVLSTEFAPLITKAGKVFITLVATITVLEHFQVNVASLVVSLGVGSLAVGLAAQDTLANMFAGFTLMLDRPFRSGERIRIATGEVGDVQAIGIRATTIKTLEETILIVPNSLLVKERLVNLSRPARAIAASVEVALPYGTDVERVRGLLLEAAAASDHVAPEPKPVVLVQRFGEYALHIALAFHARDYAAAPVARSEVAERVYTALREAGIPIAVAPARA